MIRFINRLINRFGIVLVDSKELQSTKDILNKKLVLDKKIILWYRMYKGENFAKFFDIKIEG